MKCSTKIREELRIKRAQYHRRWKQLFAPGVERVISGATRASRLKTLEKKMRVIDRYLDRCRF